MLDDPLVYLHEEEMEFSAANRTVAMGAGPSEVQFCLICLDTSEVCKLYPANTYNLDEEFEHLTGLSLQGEMHLLPQFCTECAQRLSNCSKFRNKCLTAYHLLLELVEANELLTAQEILSLSRSNNLTSRIAKKSFPPDFYDLYLIHEEQEDYGIKQELPTNTLTLNPDLKYDDKNEDVEFIQELQLPNNKAIKIEVECVNGKRILNPFPENEDIIYETKTGNFDDFQTNVEYLEDIDVDIDIDIDRDEGTKKVDKCINDANDNAVDNNCIYLSDSDIDNDLESDVVNNESYTENVKVMPATCPEGKIKVIGISKKPKSKSKNREESNKPKSKSKNLQESNKSWEVLNKKVMQKSEKPKCTKVLDLELSKEYKRVAEKVHTSMNDVINGNYLKDCDNDCKSVLVNDENVNITPTNCSNGKTTVIQERMLKSMNKINNKRSAIDTEDLSSQYTITRLTHEEQISDIQKRKEKQGFKNSPYKCMTCFKGFFIENAYKTHMEKHTDKCGQFVCAVCGVHYNKQYKVNTHVTYSHSTRYSCNTCELVTGSKTVAKYHLKRHKGVTYSCPHCPYKQRSQTGYLSHLRIAHPSDVVCHLCGYSFVNQKGIQQHLRLKHRHDNVPNPAGPLCEPCNIRFASDDAYEQHLQVSPKHAARGELKRNDPHRIIARKLYRSRGVDKTAVHAPTKVTCEQCGKQLDGFRSYTKHFRIHHPDKIRTRFSQCKMSDDGSTEFLHLCEICGKSFGSRYSLNNHMVVRHSGEREFQCDMCKKKFCLKSNLQAHIKSHEAEYECPVCQKKFNNKANFKRHTLTHSKVKPVKCDVCNKTYVDENSVRWHIHHVHFKKPYPKRQRGVRLRASRARNEKNIVGLVDT